MIELTRLNGSLFFVNPDHLLFVEPTPDTMITLMDGEKLMVEETPQQVIERFLAYKKQVTGGVTAREYQG